MIVPTSPAEYAETCHTLCGMVYEWQAAIAVLSTIGVLRWLVGLAIWEARR